MSEFVRISQILEDFDESTANDNGVGDDYLFGIVESVGASEPCEQENTYGCWTGEDCSGTAFVTPEGNSINNKCHDVYTVVSTDEDTKTIEQRFIYSSSVASFLAQPSADSATTAFPNPDNEKYEFRVSYFLKDIQTGACWAWGVDPDYFNEQNCDFPSRYQEDLSLPHTQIIVLD